MFELPNLIESLRLKPPVVVLVLLYLFLFSLDTTAQKIVKGRVFDLENSTPVPFASVAVKGKTTGTTTDFEGNFSLTLPAGADSLLVAFMGYQPKAISTKKYTVGSSLEIYLKPSQQQLREVVIRAGENPAWAIMRKVIGSKDARNAEKLSAYEYEAYHKVEVDIDNISEKFKKRKSVQKIIAKIEQLEKLKGEDGKALIPMFISESVARHYHRLDPNRSKQQVMRTNIKGVGMKDDSFVAQFTGTGFQMPNFYKNWMPLLRKDFMSPIADGWRGSYDYYLADTTNVGLHPCFEIDFEPKNKYDLAFTGRMYIDTLSFALVSIDATVSKGANINFVEKVRIQQEYEVVGDSAWMPEKSRLLIDVAEFSANTAGGLIKLSSSLKDIVVNKPRPTEFFDVNLEMTEGFNQKNAEDETQYWANARQDSLSREEKLAYSLIDSIGNIPSVRRTTNVINFFLRDGHIPVANGLELGSMFYSYAFNNIEGNRLRLSMRTNKFFSNRLFLSGYAAYGTLDKVWKGGGELNYVLSRKPLTVLGVRSNYDLDQVAQRQEDLAEFPILANFTRIGRLRGGAFYQNEDYVFVQRDVARDFQQTVGMRFRTFAPAFPFAFRRMDVSAGFPPLQENYQTTEFVFETRYQPGRVPSRKLVGGRVRKRNNDSPYVTFKYVFGAKGLLGSDFQYHKFQLELTHSVRLGVLGRTNYVFNAGYTPSRLPMPLLFPHLGNETVLYLKNAYNMMNVFEFVSDHYASLAVQHNFEGLLFNRLPLIQKLKLRMFATGKVLVGGLNERNQELIPLRNRNGVLLKDFRSLNDRPYVELGYGVQNIFKVLRVEFIHRVTHLEDPRIKHFGVRLSAYFSL